MVAREMSMAALNRAIKVADRVSAPVLVIAADRDTVVPPVTARKVVWQMPGRGELRTYPCGHFDLYVGEYFERGVADMLAFLTRHLAVAHTTTAA
jgi:fermentation-respiration switch protein FrsA (DUF1100 family)